MIWVLSRNEYWRYNFSRLKLSALSDELCLEIAEWARPLEIFTILAFFFTIFLDKFFENGFFGVVLVKILKI